MVEDDGVLGNLPRSRPGTRSDKRKTGRPAAAAGAAAEKAEQKGTAAERPAARAKRAQTGPKSRARAKPAATGPRAAGAAGAGAAGAARRQREDPPWPSQSGEGDPLGQAVRAATKLAGGGVRLAGSAAHEVWRRLPRP